MLQDEPFVAKIVVGTAENKPSEVCKTLKNLGGPEWQCQILNLSNNELGPGGAVSLSQALMVNSTLSTLNLHANGLGLSMV